MSSFGCYDTGIDTDELPYNESSRKREDFPLAINCAGVISTDVPFVTNNPTARVDYYLMYLVEGNLTVHLPDGDYYAKPFEAFIFPPEFMYKYTYSGGKPLRYYWLHFSGSEVEKRLEEFDFGNLPTHFKVGFEERISDEYKAIFDAFSTADQYRDYELSCRMGSILTLFKRSSLSAKCKTPLYHSLHFISSSYNQNITVEQLASMECISPSRYSVLFKQQTGTSPIEYVTRIRMKNAATLLTTTNMSVGNIALMVGYPDNHFFSKTFKARMGFSPLHYRKLYTKQ